ncbi:hypothetical protein [Methylobacterium oryzihabitans]|uniref:Uncharacterized protein n=1 Tax=Methylobacterium oryzihabitans TaxID=2499852 RepID=A0A3S2VB08_9HYPH|nr:hypothetical protein [Methylobacterium oryzihabitans]RVU20158.1 hypothetical protein EOE48_05990 [Methylobacterium oryzihabitans]
MSQRGDGPTRPLLRMPLLAATVLAGLTVSAEAARSPLRTALATQGGCGAHRALVEQRLGPLDAAAVFPSQVSDPHEDLFGKPADLWTEADIRDALAVYAACEDREQGPPLVGKATPRPETARLERMLRRLIALSQAKDAAEDQSERSSGPPPARPPGKADAQPRERRGTAFAPNHATAPIVDPFQEKRGAAGPVPAGGPDDGDVAASLTGGAGQAAQAVTQVASADAAAAIGPDAALRQAGQGGDRARLPGARAPSGLALVPPPPVCALTLAGFRQVRAEMPVREVEATIGCSGILDTATLIPGVGEIEIYNWTDERTNARITMTFYDKRLKRKSQRGLD